MADKITPSRPATVIHKTKTSGPATFNSGPSSFRETGSFSGSKFKDGDDSREK